MDKAIVIILIWLLMVIPLILFWYPLVVYSWNYWVD